MNQHRGSSFFSLATGKKHSTSDEDYQKISAWFLGPKGENKTMYLDLLNKSISEHIDVRKNYYPQDSEYIDEETKCSESYKNALNTLETNRKYLSDKLSSSVPFFSMRYQAHMNGDTLIPGSIGYMTAMLYNQNNVATEASPVTSALEKEDGEDLCELLGYDKTTGWGHITADGTIANIEAMWAARNLKAYPLAIQEMVRNTAALAPYRDQITVTVFESSQYIAKKLLACNSWQLLNMEAGNALSLMEQINKISGIDMNSLNTFVKPYLLASKGIASYAASYPEFSNVKIFVPATFHYSWPKSATLLGLGQDSVIGIPVDEYCKMNTEELRKQFELCLEKKYPVIMTVAVIGSTAEGAIDDLEKIIDLQNEFKNKGLCFSIHCDAAWGGYLRSMMVEPKTSRRKMMIPYVPNLPLSYYARKQYSLMNCADTITIDPHKAGLIPYAAGALCYQDKRLRNLISFNAAYIHSSTDTNMGIYGVEGSKAGATVAGVWLAHKTIGLNNTGYGQILGECSYSAKMNFCHWITLTKQFHFDNDNHSYQFHVLPLIPLPEKIESPDSSIEPFTSRVEMLAYIEEHILFKDAETISKDARAMMLLENVGADVLMNTFLVNFSVDGVMNQDYNLINTLNNTLFETFSITSDDPEKEKPGLVLMMNTLNAKDYGAAFQHIVEEWNLNVPQDNDYNLNIMVNTVLQPWPNTPEFLQEMMDTFSAGVKDAIQKIILSTERPIMNVDYGSVTLQNFHKLNDFPRGSGNEKGVSDYLMSFAKELGLNCAQDSASNVIIYKPAQNTTETSPVILQAHMDMVCAVDDNHTDYDFIHNPIAQLVDENLMSGHGTKEESGKFITVPEISTSLGADDGIGVASVMTILMDKSTMKHPPIIAIFTTGEEIGMVGAKQVTLDLVKQAAPNVNLSSAKFINVDEEQDGRFCYGCAGGAGVTLTKSVHRMDCFQQTKSHIYKISLSGLLGGHSGVEIDKHHANANKLVGRILNFTMQNKIETPILTFSGGTAENAIANRASLTIAVKCSDCEQFECLFDKAKTSLLAEYTDIETTMKIELTPLSSSDTSPITWEDTQNLIDLLYLIPNDILGMIECDGYSVVETSNNVGIVDLADDTVTLQCSARSFYDAKRDFVIGQICSLASILGFQSNVHDAYTGWVQIPNSQLKPIFEDTYQELFQTSAGGRMVHAGLECGVFTELFGDIDMIACGPTITNVHTINERLQVDTVSKVIELLIHVLEKLS